MQGLQDVGAAQGGTMSHSSVGPHRAEALGEQNSCNLFVSVLRGIT